MYKYLYTITTVVFRLVLLSSLMLGAYALLPGQSINADSSPQPQNIVFDKLTSYTIPSDSPVYAIDNDHYGYIWFGMRGGVYRYDGVEIIKYSIISNEVIV